jgi:cytochrome c oxidase assembly protein subunit 15
MTRNVRRLGDLTAAAATAQVTLGITTLLYMVPVPLAALHQAGSVVLLSCFAVLLRAIGRSKVAVARDGVKKVLQTR